MTKAGEVPFKGGDENIWVASPDMLKEIAEFAGLGLSQEQIHNYYGISSATWFKALRRQPELVVAVCAGKSGAIVQVTGKLWRLIEKDDRKAICFYLDRQAGWLKPANAVGTAVHPSSDVPEMDTSDPIEAAKMYQKIMIGS